MPWRRGVLSGQDRRPVRRAEGRGVKRVLERAPSVARRSMCGVFMYGWPVMPVSSNRRSSIRMTMRFGRADRVGGMAVRYIQLRAEGSRIGYSPSTRRRSSRRSSGTSTASMIADSTATPASGAGRRAADEQAPEGLGQVIERVGEIDRHQHRMLQRKVRRRQQAHGQHEQEDRQVHVVDGRQQGGEAEAEGAEGARRHEAHGQQRGQPHQPQGHEAGGVEAGQHRRHQGHVHRGEQARPHHLAPDDVAPARPGW